MSLRRPGYVLFEHAVRVAASAALALPIAGAIRGTGVTELPNGDRALFEPGGLILLETARTLSPYTSGLVTSSLLTGFALAALLVVPQAILLVALSRSERRSVSDVVAEAVPRLPALYSLAGFGFLLRCLLFGLFITLAGFAREAAAGGNPRTEDLVFVAVALLGAFGWIAGGAFTDLSRAACVEAKLGVRGAALVALGVIRARPLRVVACYALYSSSALLLVIAIAGVVSALDVSRPEAWRFAAVAALHQLAALTLALLRARVLSETLALVSDRRLRSPVDTFAGSAAPADPSSGPAASGGGAAG